ncbi:hypothetical protein RD792_002276 [Penstemon davidsonii]|uniref:CNH domain-containing protein n=1 Tax=Penstemon davidsonii TaxID=160366 RepID=A0ABR0DQN2_9LAMI|nr:hypothetical protein RD792_002276 [Penstemon davidsonii]
MAVKPKPRTILEPIAESAVDSCNSPIKSLVLSKLSDEQTLIYVGTLSGALLSYSIRHSQNAPAEISFLNRITIPGTGIGVNSIHPVVQIGKIIVHSDGFLFLLDSSLAEPAKRVGLFKGVTASCRRIRSRKYGSNLSNDGGSHTNHVDNGNSGSSSNLFAVGVGKKLVLAELILSGSLVIMKDIQGFFDGIIITLLWVGDSIFVGTKIGYYLYNCVNGQCDLIFSLPDSSSVPRLKLLVRDLRVLLMVDNVGIIVDMVGQPVEGSLVFKEAPDSLSEIGNYVVAARDSAVELYHRKTGCCVQRFTVSGDGNGGPCMLADEENESGKLVLVATSLKVFLLKLGIIFFSWHPFCSVLICYGKVSGEEQIKDLLRKKSFKEAIFLVEELDSEGEMTKEMLYFIHAQVGFLLLFDLHFKEAVDHFLLSENMQPSELFPFIMRDPNRWTLLVPRNRYWGLHPPPTLLENVIDDGLTAIQRAAFLKKAGVEIAVDDEFLLNPPSRSDLLESAIENMIRYF